MDSKPFEGGTPADQIFDKLESPEAFMRRLKAGAEEATGYDVGDEEEIKEAAMYISILGAMAADFGTHFEMPPQVVIVLLRLTAGYLDDTLDAATNEFGRWMS